MDEEHRLWAYFKQKIDRETSVGDDLLSEILNGYEKRPCAAMASVLVGMIKEDRISLPQLERSVRFVKERGLPIDKAFGKESLSFRARSKIGNGEKLSLEEAERLYEAEAFRTLEGALHRDGLEEEALRFFREPSEGEPHRKRKAALFVQARKRLND